MNISIDLDAPDEPVLKRQQSIVTNQGQIGSCMAHAFAKVVLQNVYRFVHPMTVPAMEIDKFRSCFAVLDTSNATMGEHISQLSRDRCGDAGFKKIFLFIYLFNLIECRRLPTMQLFFEDMGVLDTALQKAILMEEPLDGTALFRKIGEFRGLRERITRTISDQRLTWITFMIENNDTTMTSQLQNILQNILSLGLYVFISLSLDESIPERMERIAEGRHDAGHAVTMVKYNDGEYTTVGSYGQGVETTRDVNKLRIRHIVYKLSYYKFVLPVYDGEIQRSGGGPPWHMPPPIILSKPQMQKTVLGTPYNIGTIQAWSEDYVKHIQMNRTHRRLENLFTANEDSRGEVAKTSDIPSPVRIGMDGRAYSSVKDEEDARARQRESRDRPSASAYAPFVFEPFASASAQNYKASASPASAPFVFEPFASASAQNYKASASPASAPFVFEPFTSPIVSTRKSSPSGTKKGGFKRKYKNRKYKTRKYKFGTHN